MQRLCATLVSVFMVHCQSVAQLKNVTSQAYLPLPATRKIHKPTRNQA